MIKLVHLTKFYKSKDNIAIGLQDINLEFHKGEFVAIVGPSGSGKTTLLNVISGMDTYEEGELLLNGNPTSSFTIEEFENYRRANVAFIFQNYQLIDSYTVLENVMIELIFKGFSKKDAKSKAKEILQKVGMGHRLKNRATKLSGGEKQRVVIARALASDAQILVCDEPTGNLDSQNSLEIMKLLKEASKDKLILFVTHDESLIQDNATRLIRIKDGHVEEDLSLKNTEQLEAYLATPESNKWSTQFYIACKNIVRTPKKSIFIFLVFLILSFVIISSIAYIPFDVTAKSSKNVEYDMYTNQDPNRIVTYLSDDAVGDLELENAVVCKNDYLVDVPYHLSTTYTNLNLYMKENSHILVSSHNIELVCGNLPQEDNEILLILNGDFSEDFLNNVLQDKWIYIGVFKGSYFRDHIYKITGIGKSSTTDDSRTDFYLTEGGRNILFEMVKEKHLYSIRNYYMSDFSIQAEGETYPINLQSTSSSKIYVNYTYKDKDFSIFLGNHKIDLSQYEVEYIYSADMNFYAGISIPMVEKLLNEVPYRCSVYVSADEIDSMVNHLQNTLNLDCFALKYANRTEYVYDITSILEKLFYFVFLFLEIIVCLFISSLITSFILGTKKKELGVLRVIGLSEKEVLHVLQIELLILMLISIGITLSIAGITMLTSIAFQMNFFFASTTKLIISFIILLVMAIIISFKWNKKMFKRSAREVLKVGENL